MQWPVIFRSGTWRVTQYLDLSAEQPTDRAEVRTLTGFLFQLQDKQATDDADVDRRPDKENLSD